MLLGIDHLVIAAADPDAAAAELERDVGLATTGGGRHEALGTFNRLVWLGDSFVELIGVFDRALAERSWLGIPTLRALESGVGLATWAIATDRIAADVASLRSVGSDLGEPMDGRRRRADGAEVRWRLAAPPALAPLSPFLIEHDPTAAEWTPADRDARAVHVHPLGRSVRLEILEIPVLDPNPASQRLTRAVGLRFRPSLAGGGSRDASVGPQIARLRPLRAASVAGLEPPTIRLVGIGAEPRTVQSVGCRWVVRTG